VNATDRQKAYKILRPWIHSFFEKRIAVEQDELEMWQQHNLSECQQTALRLAPGRIEVLNELPELLDKEFEKD
jgi:hypothetical protein